MSPRKLRKSIKNTLILTVVIGATVFAVISLNSIRSIAELKSELGQSLNLSPNDFLVNESKDTQASFITDLSVIDVHQVGSYEIEVKVGTKTYTSILKIVDTIAPLAVVQDVSVEVDGTLTPEDLIVSSTDESETTISFKAQPNLSSVNRIVVIVVLADTSGNTSEYPVTVNVVFDMTAPVILEERQLYVLVGSSSVDYWDKVTVSDAKSTIKSIDFDDQQVNLNKIGVYPMSLSATDDAGNVVTIARNVNVVMESTYYTMMSLNNPSNNKADAFVDAVIAEIIKDDMTQTEKMKAIYDWILNEMVYQTEVSHDYAIDTYNKLDDYALAGFTKLKGHCFHYAAIAALLLDTLNLEMTLIEGEGYSYSAKTHFVSHFWILVKVDGLYAHFDPLYEYLFLRHDLHLDFFLVKDDQVYNTTHRWDKSLYPSTQ
jgi:hypothetical protein